jgi:pilus assembly protein CpaF
VKGHAPKRGSLGGRRGDTRSGRHYTERPSGTALRHRPDWIIMGEIRNECGYDLLQAMNTGHGGTLSTIHAKSALDALNRLSNLALSAKPNLNHAFMRSETAEAIGFVLYCERDPMGRRKVRELIAVNGYSHSDHRFETVEIYRTPITAAA